MKIAPICSCNCNKISSMKNETQPDTNVPSGNTQKSNFGLYSYALMPKINFGNNDSSLKMDSIKSVASRLSELQKQAELEGLEDIIEILGRTWDESEANPYNVNVKYKDEDGDYTLALNRVTKQGTITGSEKELDITVDENGRLSHINSDDVNIEIGYREDSENINKLTINNVVYHRIQGSNSQGQPVTGQWIKCPD